jgi:hypothetical protein
VAILVAADTPVAEAVVVVVAADVADVKVSL